MYSNFFQTISIPPLSIWWIINADRSQFEYSFQWKFYPLPSSISAIKFDFIESGLNFIEKPIHALFMIMYPTCTSIYPYE